MDINAEDRIITEENLIKSVHQVQATADDYLREIDAQPTDSYAYGEIRSLISEFCNQAEVYGTENEFHNLAMHLAKSNLEDLACKVLERGLQIHKNVDLLADYLQYGLRCGYKERCTEYYNILKKIPKRIWTWRGFSFSIEYLQYKLDNEAASEKEIDRLVKEIEAIAEEYIKKIPYSEDSYLVRARVYQTVKDDPDKELEILNECLEKIKVCSRVALRCADIYFERGEYAKALERVQRALADANKTQGSINEGYGYYLAGLCKIAMLPKEKAKVENSAIEDIYAEFNSALLDFGWEIERTYKEIIIKKTRNLKSRYNVEIPYNYEKLIENIEE